MHRNRQMFPVLEAQADKVEMANEHIVSQCQSGGIALDTTCIASGYSKETLAEKIGKPREVLSRACSGRGGLDIDVLIKIMQEAGNTLIIQYMAKQLGGEFRFFSQDEIDLKIAEEKVAMLKAKRSA